jgi:hypothetical protein
VTKRQWVVLDECVLHRLRHALSGHDVVTASFAGLAGLKNGQLIKAIDGRYNVLVTLDGGLPHQQNLTALTFGIIVLRAPSNSLSDLLPLVPELLRVLGTIAPGTVEII